MSKTAEKSRRQILRAPVDGTVQLAVHTVGGGVTSAQALLEVVPLDSHLEIEAMVQNRDVGFVRAGPERRDQGRHLQFHQIRSAPRNRAERLGGLDRP
jgi:multidrug efflux pump subunit AcrA (membrane-fusion protein)